MSKIDATNHHDYDPLKWKKHLVLVEWELRERAHLLSSINRYFIEDYLECLEAIDCELDNSIGDYSIIVKLVYKNDFYKLPNVIVNSKADLEDAKKMIESHDLSSFSEIWYCKNKTKNNAMVFGRMLISNSQLFPNRSPIRYELVWSNSARKIERYPVTDCPFVAAERENWNSQHKILEINKSNANVDELLSYTDEIIKRTSVFTSKIKEFGCFVFSQGCNHLCLEFSFSSSEFNFIDWDTDDDIRILKNS